MQNTTIQNATTLQQLGYDQRYIITQDGQIYYGALDQPLKPYRFQQYKLKTEKGKTVIRALKPIYRAIYGQEYAEDNIEDIDGEEWRKIDDTGRYYISSMGRVKSYIGKNARILKPYTNQKGYCRVDIKLETRRTYLVHQLVALAFIDNDNPIVKDTVDHIDGNKWNNAVSNLRWLSRGDNVRAYQQKLKESSQNA